LIDLAGTNGLFYLLYGLAVFVTGLAVGIGLDDVGKSATVACKRAFHESNPQGGLVDFPQNL
jgi:hypothetical protein